MYCDLCNKVISSGEVVRIPLREMQKAVRDGFNPFKTTNVDVSSAMGLAGLFGLGSEQVFKEWRQRLMTDTTDWGLCSACAEAFRRGTTQAPIPQSVSMPPVSQEDVRKVPCKRCGTLILPSTAQKTGGYCMPCFSGSRTERNDTSVPSEKRHENVKPKKQNKIWKFWK
jgi:hypothetical protein